MRLSPLGLFFLAIGFMVQSVLAQSPYTKYVVLAGETLEQIAKKNGLSSYAIQQLNPDFKTKWKTGLVLLLPPKDTILSSKDNQTYTVQAQDTWYSISKKHQISVANLQEANATLIDKPLALGAVLTIPTTKSAVKNGAGSHVVQAQETLYSIARLYQVTPDQLRMANPSLPEVLPIGFNLNLPKDPIKQLAPPVFNTKKDTVLSINKRSVQDQKTIILALPLHLNKVFNDSVNTMPERLKKDKFLNITLDFYNGAMKALDSANALGWNYKIKVIDSEETKSNSSLSKVMAENELEGATALIGPFFQGNVDKWAAALQSKNIPVFSPLSKEGTSGSQNVYQTITNADTQKRGICAYLAAQNNNVVVIADPKKASFKSTLQAYKEWQWLGLTSKGAVCFDSLQKRLVKNKLNYLVIASEKTSHVLGLLKSMKLLQKNYQLQLVSLESSETLEYDEIPLEQLIAFKLLIPSGSRTNMSPEFEKFRQAYRKTNKLLPNDVAIRGFDVVFDVLYRLQNNVPPETRTDRWQQRFKYQSSNAGFENQAFYLLQYESDLTAKPIE
ncbi:MAG: hypothetical protein CFE24_00105 [Flavobacterium sp. BFFFF2]|nr:MAG: hypothetical protein CFE24_00105 [Flavobacterium sp. BFFFF2]